MKNIITYMIIGLTAVFAGCKSMPTPENMGATATAIGYATGMVANNTKIDDESRNVVVDIVNEVAGCVPAAGQTFEDAWTPIAKAHTQKLVDDGKLDDKQAEIVLCAFKTVVKGIDYMFTVRYPKAREYEELVSAAVRGFTTGFLTTFKPVNAVSAGAVNYDVEAYNYLNTNK